MYQKIIPDLIFTWEVVQKTLKDNFLQRKTIML